MLFLTILGQFKNAYNDYLLSQTPPLISPLPVVHAADSDGGTVSKLETVEIKKLKIKEIKEVKTEVVYVEKEEETIDKYVADAVEEFVNGAGQQSKAKAIMHCLLYKESKHDYDKGHGDNGRAGGILQFHQPTWERMRSQMKAQGIDTPEATRYDPKEAIRTAVWALTQGRGQHLFKSLSNFF